MVYKQQGMEISLEFLLVSVRHKEFSASIENAIIMHKCGICWCSECKKEVQNGLAMPLNSEELAIWLNAWLLHAGESS